jgi:hypothetical protein
MVTEHPLVGRLLSALGLLALVVGAPVLLTVSHATPPVSEILRVLSTPSDWGHLLRSRLADGGVADIVALVAWIGWLWLTLCVGVELTAAVRGIPSLRLPGSRYAQSVAAFLVGASIAVIPIARSSPQLRFEATGSITSGLFRSLSPSEFEPAPAAEDDSWQAVPISPIRSVSR